jgi:hypothetical protein
MCKSAITASATDCWGDDDDTLEGAINLKAQENKHETPRALRAGLACMAAVVLCSMASELVVRMSVHIVALAII